MSTPLMKQYAEVKAKYPGTILLFRMGDFFETFDEDAKITSRVLGITLTRRGNGAAGETPLAGFPHHALDTYLPKLLKAGLRVAVCEQMEDPKFAKGIVKRDVIEVVSPGVAFSDKVLDQKQNNYLAAVALPSAVATGDDTIGFSYVDISTGEFAASEIPFRELEQQINSVMPSELLVQKRDKETLQALLKASYNGLFTTMDDWVFHFDYGYETLVRHFQTQSLKGFGIDTMSVGIAAAGSVMHYLNETQKANLAHIQKIVPHDISDTIVLDGSTKRNLEITSSFGGTSDGTLFSVLDRCMTPMGGRLLKKWISHPLKSLEQIRWRSNGISSLVEQSSTRKNLSAELAEIGDVERLIAKIATGRATPRDMVAMKQILRRIPVLKKILADITAPTVAGINAALQTLDPVADTIERAIADNPPMSLADGGVIRRGYNTELDELTTLAHSAKEWVANMQKKERERTGISSLKIGFNNVFGYYIEITHTHKDKIPADYIRKQTMTNAERFITPELKEYEEKILHAEEKILALETRLFNELRLIVASHAGVIQQNAQQIAVADCLASLAQVAEANNYVQPEVNDSSRLYIEEGRHPVIEILLPVGEKYVSNSVSLDTAENQILIITGPNMSGKSSYLRQVGLIVLLAQIGSFVPAKKAAIGLVDNIFTRVGASDNIASGESTFLVEMHEAANIVNRATSRSLILLDEVGRGTSTFDGISIAWALTEYLHEHIGARTLFATHYHELNELAELFPRIKNYKVDVREYGDKVIFLHTVTPGTADHSYGIQVAKMAGLPEELTERAKKILDNLEETQLRPHGTEENGEQPGEKPRSRRGIASKNSGEKLQLTMFEMKDDELRATLNKLEIDSLTPLEALKILAKLKENSAG
ncbi:MAG TPA: DNA mismatch repair protein MutS [Bacteroidota bacterium]|nr:DNA mismatch repair protein MutS [Bacteroidota bacterium]